MKTNKCIICGKTFETKRNAMICGPYCRRIRVKQLTRESREAKKEEKSLQLKKKGNLDKMINEAAEHGMSYGKYMAIKSGYLIDK